MSKTQIPEVLSITRSMEISDGTMENVRIEKRTMRTVKNYEGSKKENDKKDSANIVKGDIAYATGDRVRISFDIKPMPFDLKVHQCSDVAFYLNLKSKLEHEENEHMLRKLMHYYAYNILNGRWLWRNRDVAERVFVSAKVFLAQKSEPEAVISAEDADLWDRDILIGGDGEIVCERYDDRAVRDLAQWLFRGIWGKENLHIHVEAHLDVENGAQMYPSQAFSEKTVPSQDEGKVLVQRDGVPLITSQKIGNALRTFDVWYPSYEDLREPIPVEFYGGSLKYQENLRPPKLSARYLLERYMEDEDSLAQEEKLYLLAVLLRGGPFPKANEKKGKGGK